MTMKGRLQRLERVLGLQEPSGPAVEAALAIARVLKSPEQERA